MFVHSLSHRMSIRRAESSSGDAVAVTAGGFKMGSGWRRARSALGFNSCASAQPDPDDDALRDDDRSSTDTAAIAEAGEVSTSEPSMDSSRPTNVTPAAATPPATPSRSSSRLNLIRTSIRLSRSTCAICLESMKPGHGQALFTAECSHTFHFSCIASNVRHGNLVCPVCRAKWKEVPWQAPADLAIPEEPPRPAGNVNRAIRRLVTVESFNRDPQVRLEISPDDEDEHRRADPVLRILDESIANARGIRRIGPQEPSVSVFDDDEPLSPPLSVTAEESDERREASSGESGEEQDTVQTDTAPTVVDNEPVVPGDRNGGGEGSEQDGLKQAGTAERDESRRGGAEIVMTCHPEVCTVLASEEIPTFSVLVHLKSLASKKRQWGAPVVLVQREEDRGKTDASCIDNFSEPQALDPSCRAPLDLVTVLDISGSMAGTKLMLLKRAMAFVIRNLSPADRLSVVAFSSSARRLFPLRRMAEEGRRHALRCVDSLVSTGGTNIADGLRKGAKMLEDRRMKNPVASIMLLSDGQDTYTMGNRGQYSGLAAPRLNNNNSSDFIRLLPGSMRNRFGEAQIPVHTFGFGADHDAATMHSIAEVSGGTFSFIQAEGAVQDAFAQCIGGLLSVVVQDTNLQISTGTPGVVLKAIEAGSYETSITEGGNQGEVKLGDLYADEERDILLELKLPAISEAEMEGREDLSTVLRVSCAFRDPVSTGVCRTTTADVQISRVMVMDGVVQSVSLDVDRQRNRVRVARSILEAGILADNGEISLAQQILTKAKEELYMSAAFKAGDQLSTGLEAELSEIQLRVASRQVYERTGRAYILSAQSSHFRQRATTRGDFNENHSREYQTSSMADMVSRSQTLAIPRDLASASATSTQRGHHAGRPMINPSPTRMLLRRSSGRVQDSHGHRES